jgi:hypothetical protein
MLDNLVAKLDKMFAEKDERIVALEAELGEYKNLFEGLAERYGLGEEVAEEEVSTPEQFEEDVLESVEPEVV